MSRSDTMQRDTYRVQVRAGFSGAVTHESYFRDEKSAQDYFDSFDIDGSTKRIERRFAGAARFTSMKRTFMGLPDPPHPYGGYTHYGCRCKGCCT